MDLCTFCGRPRNEVKCLVPATDPNIFICNRCVDQAKLVSGMAPKAATKEEKPLPKPKEIKATLDVHVISQEMAKTDISIAVYDHYKRREAGKRGVDLGVEITKSNILLMGSSGTGKTEISRTIAKTLGVPFFVGDATKLTQAGYVGDDIESLFQGLLADCDNDPEKAQWGIIFIDEFDKMARKSGRGASGYRDVSGEGVQQALLKVLEGAKIQVPIGSGFGSSSILLDTENILFICAGSFAGIDEIVKRRINKHSRMGFGAESTKKALTDTEVYLQVTEDDILEFGLIPELLGRIPVHTTTLPLTEEDMVRILTEPKNALIKQVKAMFAMDGAEILFDEDALRAIGKDASTRPTGARSLRSIVTKLVKSYAYEVPSDPTIKKIHITKDVVEGKSEAHIERTA